MPNETPIVFRNNSNYNYYLIIKTLANESEGKLECLRENAENYKTFSIRIVKKVTEIDKDINESLLIVHDLWQLHYKILLI